MDDIYVYVWSCRYNIYDIFVYAGEESHMILYEYMYMVCYFGTYYICHIITYVTVVCIMLCIYFRCIELNGVMSYCWGKLVEIRSYYRNTSFWITNN